MLVVLVMSLLAVIAARPSEEFVSRNTVTVPPNCPPGQEWYNGSCREPFRSGRQMSNRAQDEAQAEIDANEIASRRLLDVPDLLCPVGFKRDALGNCRKELPK